MGYARLPYIEADVTVLLMEVQERAKWKPFGAAAAGNEGTASRSYDEVHFEKPGVQEEATIVDQLGPKEVSLLTNTLGNAISS